MHLIRDDSVWTDSRLKDIQPKTLESSFYLGGHKIQLDRLEL